MKAWRRAIRATSTGLIPMLLAVQIEGCAGTGASSHSISSIRRPGGDSGPTTGLDVARIDRGSEVELLLQDGTLVRGRYRGVVRMSGDDYREHAARVIAARPDSLPLPAFGSLLELQPRRGSAYQARLLSFGLRTLEVRRDEAAAPVFVPFHSLTSVRESSGLSWTGTDLLAQAESGWVPADLEVVVRVAAGDRRIAADRVAEVTYRNSAGDLVTGLLLIAGVVAIIVIIAAATYEPSCSNIDLGDFGTGLSPVRTRPDRR